MIMAAVVTVACILFLFPLSSSYFIILLSPFFCRWRPWDMVLVVHGFATQTAALQFEWAWQHPDKSLDTREAAVKLGKKARYGVRGKVLMLMEMLNTSPWKHYPLKIQFLRGEHVQLRAGCPEPPSHVLISVGPLENLEYLGGGGDSGDYEEDDDDVPEMSGITASQITEAPSQSQSQVTTTKRGRGASACCICTKAASRTWAVCSSCPVRSHVGCLAEHFLASSGLYSSSLPSRGNCPACGIAAIWSEVLATMKHAGWAKHKKKAGEGDEPTITEVDEEVDMELPSVPSSPKRPNKISKIVVEPRAEKTAAAVAAVAETKLPVAAAAVPPPVAPAPAPWLDDAPPNWNCRDAIAAALEKVDGSDRNKKSSSSQADVAGGAAGFPITLVEEAAPWDDYDQSDHSSGDENENIIDLVSPSSPLKNINKEDSENIGGDGAGGGGIVNISKETEIIELLSSDDET
jgi:hypothetical protein